MQHELHQENAGEWLHGRGREPDTSFSFAPGVDEYKGMMI